MMYLMPSNSASEPRTLHPCTFYDRNELPATDKDFRAKAVPPTTFQKPGGATTFSEAALVDAGDGFPPPHSDEPTEFDMTPEEAAAALTSESEDLGLYNDGVTDQTETIQALVDKGADIPAGTHPISAPLNVKAGKKSTGPAPD